MKRTIQIRLLCLGVFLILRNFGLDTVSAQTLIGTEINGVQVGDEYGRTVVLSSDGKTMAAGSKRWLRVERLPIPTPGPAHQMSRE